MNAKLSQEDLIIWSGSMYTDSLSLNMINKSSTATAINLNLNGSHN